MLCKIANVTQKVFEILPTIEHKEALTVCVPLVMVTF